MRLAKGATVEQARQEVCKLFAGDGLKSVPTVNDWWAAIRHEKVVSLTARKMRAALGLKP